MTALIRPRGWLAVFVAIVFTTGVGTGLLLRGYLEETPAASNGFLKGPPPFPPLLAPRLATELNLTAEQQRQLQTILDARRERLLENGRQMRGRARDEVLGVATEIDKILTPEQREHFKPVVEQIRSRFQDAGAFPPWPPPR